MTAEHTTKPFELAPLRLSDSSAYLRAAARFGRSQRRFGELDWSHPLERYLGHPAVRRLLGFLSRDRAGGKPYLMQALLSYRNAEAPLWQRLLYWPLHRLIDHFRGEVSPQTVRERFAGHLPTVIGLVNLARSLHRFGLTLPQRFVAPLIVVWNITNRCNLRCKHCYQQASAEGLADELSLEEKLAVVDELARNYTAMVAFAGGEPTICPDLEPVLARCQRYGIHTTIATHGATLTAQKVRRYRDLGVKYIEISLDSVNPAQHDALRGVPGTWRRAVEGVRLVASTPGVRAGVAMTVTTENIDQLEQMIELAIRCGASCFAHFNFIPVGRGRRLTHLDLSPEQRERVLRLLNRYMQQGRIGVLSTAPQFGRVALAFSPLEGKVACSHAGGGTGLKARVVARYLGGCGAGRTYACIEPNGDLTPCVYMPHRVYGNLRHKQLSELFLSGLWELCCDRDHRGGHCAVCRFKYYCGGCLARADAYFGRPDAGDPGCIFNQQQFVELLRDGTYG